MNTFKEFTNLYPVSKTLRFELKPVGDTLKNIQEHGILDEDNKKAMRYAKMKKIIDLVHKDFIDESLEKTTNKEQINQKAREYKEIYESRDEKEKEKIETVQKEFREMIVAVLEGKAEQKQKEKYANLFKKELFTKILPEYIENKTEHILKQTQGLISSKEEITEILKEFDGFTTYFTSFQENRKNIYDKEGKSTAVAYRIVHENLPKFLDNIASFKKIEGVLKEEIAVMNSAFYEHIGCKIEEVFSIEHFSKALSQKGIERYNAVIGKIVGKDKGEIVGLNQYINLYNQKNKKDSKLPLLKPLYKQILSDREQLSWLPESFDNDEELISAVKKFYNHISTDVINNIYILLSSLESQNLSGIFIKNDTTLTEISNKLFGSWDVIEKARIQDYDKHFTGKKANGYEDKRKKELDKEKSLSIERINKLIDGYEADIEKRKVESYFATEVERITTEIKNNYQIAKDIFDKEYKEDSKISQDEEAIEKIKNLLDSMLSLQRLMKMLSGDGKEVEKDNTFYGDMAHLTNETESIIALYNKVRSYITKKPYSTEKIKLNFKNYSLLSGWDKNKEKDNTAVILIKDGKYYLGIINKKYNKIFEGKMPTDGDCYQKMNYKFFKDITTMVPKCSTQLKEVIAHFEKSDEDIIIDNKKNFNAPLTITKEIFDLNNVKYGNKEQKKFQKGYLNEFPQNKKEFEKAVKTWINFCMEFLSKYDSCSNYNYSLLKPLEEYRYVNNFYNDVNQLLYKVTFQNIATHYVNKLLIEGKLYLFEIYNKDFSEHSKGKPNLHTIYWRMLFDKNNLDNVIYKLDGGAEMFFRKKSLEYKETHPANKGIKRKKTGNEDKESIFKYPLIKDKRYTMDKFQFHVPITINFRNSDELKVTPKVNRLIRENKDIKVIGIDRGERNLIYVSLIDSKGRIKEQFDLNKIEGFDYHELLERRGKERQEGRKNWKNIEGIKDIKKGYLSQVVSKISKLAIKNNAIIALEDLNMGFKNTRQKFESSVYQQFEKQLIDKLNLLVDKETEVEKEGGALKAYQLTNPFESFKKMGKQNGIILYVPVWNTSKIDPTTGFVNMFGNIAYESVEKARTFFSKFEKITYNKEEHHFEFQFDYKDFTTRAKDTRTKWTLCSYGKRIETFRNPEKNSEWDNRDIVLTDEIKKLFNKYKIDYEDKKVEITKMIVQNKEKDFFLRLIHLFKLMIQMRNSNKNTGEDYIISPVKNDTGRFFDSRDNNEGLPKDADANGAYNIALKGLWAMKQIRKSEKPKLAISNEEWLNFVQKKEYLKD